MHTQRAFANDGTRTIRPDAGVGHAIAEAARYGTPGMPWKGLTMDVPSAVQMEMLRSIDRTGYIQHAEIAADRRDIDRGGAAGAERSDCHGPPRDSTGAGPLMELTDLGRERLANR